VIRGFRPGDRPALYRVCLQTSDSGRDGTGKYRDPLLVGEVFVGPYLALQPDLAFVVDDGAGAEGYVLGALDTVAFRRDCELQWWPALRARYQGVRAPEGYSDGWLLDWVRRPPKPPAAVTEFPSHLHIDMLPRWQGGGWGRRLIDTLCAALAAAGSPGVHLEVGRNNAGAIGFYRHIGFAELSEGRGALVMGRRLKPSDRPT
jgi:ribosomal protein S18 acetylase RimI-like enzyme